MNAITEHVRFDVLNDLVDGRLAPELESTVREHLAACQSCQREHETLRSLLRAAADAPRSISPDAALWSAIRGEIDSRKQAVLPTEHAQSSGRPSEHAGQAWWNRPRFLAAAAVVLIVGSSSVTTLVLRRNDGSISAIAGVSPSPLTGERVLPVGFVEAESQYLRTIADLRSALGAQRSRLHPETVAAVERSLAVVDSAIAEARSALLGDPSNRTLVDILSASYQRKLDLLRRASELGGQT